MEQYTFNKDQIEAIMYGYASHIAAYDTKVISALDWLSKYGPATTPPPAKAEQEGYKTFEEKSIKWYRENYGKEFPYKLCEWMFNELSTTPPVKEVAYDELWDEFSEYIDDDIDSLSIFAGRTVLTEAQYNKLVAKLKAAPVKEAGQPPEQQYPANWGHGDYEGYVMMLQNRIKELESRQQPAGVFLPFTKDARLPKNEDFLVKYDTGEIRRYQEEEQPFGIVTHYMILNDESGAYTKQ